MRDLAHEAALWREQRKLVVNPRQTTGKPPPLRNTDPPRDEMLEDILRRRADLDMLTPAGALPCPLLWFAPMIDRERVEWIAQSAPVGHAPAGSSAHCNGIAPLVARAHAWAPLLFSKSLPVRHSIDVACALFTGRSPITADLELAYNSGG